MSDRVFPLGFVWGAATASYQIEGAVTEDGKGLSTWDEFCSLPGRIHNDDTGAVAADHYHRMPEDVELIKQLGLKAYRFSISWPRIFPDGKGKVNQKGLDFYSRLVDELLKAEITPYVTLFHWDLPQSLEDGCGGWLSRDTAQYFADYAGFIAEKFSGKINNYITTNEFANFTDKAYGTGFLAPGKMYDEDKLCVIRHNALYGHGLAVKAIRDVCDVDVRVGIAEGLNCCIPVYDSENHIKAARTAFRRSNMFITTILEGAYPDYYLKDREQYLSDSMTEDMEVIGSELDFVGINIYSPTHILADDSEEHGYRVVPKTESYPKMQSPWAYIDSRIAYWAPRFMKELWDVKELMVVENGCAAKDRVNENGEVLDTDRVMYMRDHLMALLQSISEGYPVTGYFAWSLLDNFEWIRGYSHRFGLYYVNYSTQERIPKLSAEFYKEVIRRNEIV